MADRTPPRAGTTRRAPAGSVTPPSKVVSSPPATKISPTPRPSPKPGRAGPADGSTALRPKDKFTRSHSATQNKPTPSPAAATKRSCTRSLSANHRSPARAGRAEEAPSTRAGAGLEAKLLDLDVYASALTATPTETLLVNSSLDVLPPPMPGPAKAMGPKVTRRSSPVLVNSTPSPARTKRGPSPAKPSSARKASVGASSARKPSPRPKRPAAIPTDHLALVYQQSLVSPFGTPSPTKDGALVPLDVAVPERLGLRLILQAGRLGRVDGAPVNLETRPLSRRGSDPQPSVKKGNLRKGKKAAKERHPKLLLPAAEKENAESPSTSPLQSPPPSPPPSIVADPVVVPDGPPLVSCFAHTLIPDDPMAALPAQHHHLAKILQACSRSPHALARAVNALVRSEYDFYRARSMLNKKVTIVGAPPSPRSPATICL
eukprot:TRINITY_DN4195_c0_g1_i2.p1 TRINITY_DN4195_c0_g1~~TRINITY_DN4195_c0_g1_i2.p1  ORF type:complete len:447 (+),score=55.45 TRINITY_DN4195_c0_g1_i2:47-1342(+)